MKKIKGAVVISDIRNFTGTFEKFQKLNNSAFLNFINDFYNIQIDIANNITKNYWCNSLGDSMLFVFTGENHSKNAFLFSILSHKKISEEITIFNDINNEKISFGMGVESGDVFEVKKDGKIFTYLGNVINIVSRIEKLTKQFGNTELLVGENIYNYLMQKLYPKYHYVDLFDNYNKIINENPESILISKKLFLYFIFNLYLDGIKNPIALFRYDNYLAKNEIEFNNLIKKLQ